MEMVEEEIAKLILARIKKLKEKRTNPSHS